MGADFTIKGRLIERGKLAFQTSIFTGEMVDLITQVSKKGLILCSRIGLRQMNINDTVLRFL